MPLPSPSTSSGSLIWAIAIFRLELYYSVSMAFASGIGGGLPLARRQGRRKKAPVRAVAPNSNEEADFMTGLFQFPGYYWCVMGDT